MWKRLTQNDLAIVLAADEIDKLSSVSLDSDLSGIIQSQLDAVADQFRGAFRARGYTVDVREHMIPPEYVIPVLNYARWQIFTRFPMSESYALSDPRKLGYEEAVALLKNPYIGTSKPDYSDDPDLSGRTDLTDIRDAAITLPFQRFPSVPYEDGFWEPYAYEFQRRFGK